MNQHSLLFGLVTRVEDDYVFVWGSSHRLKEVITYKHLFPKITAGDVVQYKLSDSLDSVQENMELKKIVNHDLTIFYPPQNVSQFRVKTNILFPPADSNYFENQYNYFKTNPMRCKLMFMAFSLEFGTVASFVDLKYEPGKTYKGYVARLPPNFDMLKKYIDTIFCVVDAELKEILSENEVNEIKRLAPWKTSLVEEDRNSYIELINPTANAPILIMPTVNSYSDTNRKDSINSVYQQQSCQNSSPSSGYNTAVSSFVHGGKVNWGEPLDDEDNDFVFMQNQKMKKQVSWSVPIDSMPLISVNSQSMYDKKSHPSNQFSSYSFRNNALLNNNNDNNFSLATQYKKQNLFENDDVSHSSNFTRQSSSHNDFNLKVEEYQFLSDKPMQNFSARENVNSVFSNNTPLNVESNNSLKSSTNKVEGENALLGRQPTVCQDLLEIVDQNNSPSFALSVLKSNSVASTECNNLRERLSPFESNYNPLSLRDHLNSANGFNSSSFGVNNSVAVPATSELMSSTIGCTSSLSQNDIQKHNSLLSAIDENCRQLDKTLHVDEDTSLSLLIQQQHYTTGLESLNSTTAQSLQCVAAVVCYRKPNYALVYLPTTQQLAVLLKSSFIENGEDFDDCCQIGHWIEGVNILFNLALPQTVLLPGFAVNTKHQIIRSRALKIPLYPTRIVRKTYQKIGVPNTKPQTFSSVQVKISINLEVVLRRSCADSQESIILSNTGMGNVLAVGPMSALDSPEGSVNVWIGFMASPIQNCHWKIITESTSQLD